MKVVIQRVSKASVSISGKIKGMIDHGFLILLGIEQRDDRDDVLWLIRKIIALRIFSDAEGKMNKNLKEVNGSMLLISQFTLHASIKKGSRPSFIKSARPEQAMPLYEFFIHQLEKEAVAVKTGEFGEDMQVTLTNDGPVTIIIDSKNRE